jgi:predicted nucleic-acid-binding protein
MLAIDTNVLVRYVVGDGGGEFARAVNVVENNAVWIALTVVLETEWVLRDVYEFSRVEVLSSLARLFGLPTVSVAEPLVVGRAMKLAQSGMDFADALHLAQAPEKATFVTFDKALVKRGSRHVGLAVKLA